MAKRGILSHRGIACPWPELYFTAVA